LARILGARAPLEEPTAAQEAALRLAALAGFPDRVCKRRAPGSADLTFASGASARLSEQSCVRDAELLVAVDAEERREAAGAQRAPGRAGAVVRLASAIEPEWLLELFPDE